MISSTIKNEWDLGFIGRGGLSRKDRQFSVSNGQHVSRETRNWVEEVEQACGSLLGCFKFLRKMGSILAMLP